MNVPFITLSFFLYALPASSFASYPINSYSYWWKQSSEHHHKVKNSVRMGGSSNDASHQLITLPQYLHDHGVDHSLHVIICQAAKACLEVSQELAKFPISSLQSPERIEDENLVGGNINIQGEEQQPMDVVANEIFIKSLKDHAAALASEEEEEIIKGNDQNPPTTIGSSYEIAFDPLDGSSNLDVQIATGSIFGISPHNPSNPFSSPGRSLVAAGYSVYSSSLEFVISLSSSAMTGSQNDGSSWESPKQAVACGFTLDPRLLSPNKDVNEAECFILTKPNMRCPSQGNFYSLNDGREPDWPEGLQNWIRDAKRGKTPSGRTYSSRYVCSLCADVHRTFIKGGWAGNPRPHLRLLYEAAPLAHIAEACGGRGSDGVQNLLDIKPEGLHSRTCVFIGSIEDVQELESYGDVQQTAKTY